MGPDAGAPPRAIPIQASSATGARASLADATVEASSRQVKVGGTEPGILTTVLPVAARETLVVKDSHGAVVRTLVDELRGPGTYRDGWDGLGGGEKRLPDGQYFWVASFDDGTETRVIDLTAEKDGDAEVKSHPEYPKWDPFDNRPLRFSHTFDRPGEIAIVFARETYYVRLSCEAPKFCRFLPGYQPAGTFTYEWAGVDDTGAYREDIHGIFVISHHEDLAKNGIVVFGGRPTLSNVRVDPTLFRPGLGTQVVSFSLGTYRGERVSAVVTFTNQESRSVLRTLKVDDVAAGTVKVPWDGRGENRSLVAPGNYTVRVVVTDTLGESAQGEILTRIEY